ncbi:MAG: hypothetical protein FD149_2249, partial [Rhodospirillaceae bacterium]
VLEDMARAWYETCVRLEEQSLAAAVFEDSSEFDEAVDEAARAAEQTHHRVLADAWEEVTSLAAAILRRNGAVLERTDPSYETFCRLMLRAMAAAAFVKAERLGGNSRPQPPDSLFAMRP